MSDCCCGCCQDSCPEPVSTVTINEPTAVIEGVELEFSIEQVVPLPSRIFDITVQVVDADGNAVAGHYALRFWLSENAVPSLEPSTWIPTTPGVARFERVTDANGSVTVRIDNAAGAATHVLYLQGEVNGRIYVSDAFTL